MQWLTGTISAGEPGFNFLLLVLAALIVGLYIWGCSRRDKGGRADRLQETYRRITREALETLKDEELLDAVIANLLAKLDPKKPDPYTVIPLLSRGRRAVYSIWLTCHELDSRGLRGYLCSPSGRFAEFAADGLELIGASESAAVLRDGLELDTGDDEATSEQERRLLGALERERPLDGCRKYIRDNPGEFVDEEDETH